MLWLTIAPLDAPGFRSTQTGMAKALERLGITVHLMGKSIGGKPLPAKETTTLVPRKGRFATEILYHYALWGMLLGKGFDIVMFEPPQLRLALLPALLGRLGILRARFVMDVRTPPVDDSRQSLAELINYRLSMKFAKYFLSGITVITEALKEDIKPFFGDGLPVAVWGSAVDETLFNPSRPQPSLKKELGLEGRFIFFYHGSLSMQRGLKELLYAMEKLKTTHPEAALALLGGGIDEERLKSLAKDLGLSETVYFLKPVDNNVVPAYIAMADVGVVPLPNDRCWQVSSPLKLFEYLAMQRPVLVSDIIAHREILGDAPYAVYAKDISPEGLYGALLSCIEKASFLKTNAIGAREFVLKNHTWLSRAGVLSSYLCMISGGSGK